jgi:hypothetical protein
MRKMTPTSETSDPTLATIDDAFGGKAELDVDVQSITEQAALHIIQAVKERDWNAYDPPNHGFPARDILDLCRIEGGNASPLPENIIEKIDNARIFPSPS